MQDILDQLDSIMSQWATKDEAVDLIVKAFHEIAPDRHALEAKLAKRLFRQAMCTKASKGGVS